MGKKSGSGSGMNNPNHTSERLETIFLVKMIRDGKNSVPGWKKFGSGINIPELTSTKQKILKTNMNVRGAGKGTDIPKFSRSFSVRFMDDIPSKSG
jgi:hypothetical protein